MKTLKDDIKLFRKGQKMSKPLKQVEAQITELHAKHFTNKEYDSKIDAYLASARLRHEANKLHPQDILVDDFDNIMEKSPSYMPW